MRRREPVIAVAACLAGVAFPIVAVTPAAASPAGTALVISEVHGGGGNSGARFRNDFIELFNPTDGPISVSGMSVQWRSQNGTGAFGVTPLTGTVAPGGYYLVQEAAGTNVDAEPLPAPDATGTIAMGSSAGTALLVNGTTALTLPAGAYPGSANVIDLVGVGSNAFETAAAPTMSNQQSVARFDPEVDTDNNSVDFFLGQPLPASTTESSEPPEPPPCELPTEAVVATIREVQGSGAASPLVGQGVVTEGVVTATYYTGGYNGFYLQTAGTGGVTDTTPGVSDAVFVWGQGATTAQPAIGDSVSVTGEVSEFYETTEITTCEGSVTDLPNPLPAVTPLALAYPAGEAAREAQEGMLIAPQGDFTVTDTYATNGYAEVALAAGDEPLIQPTEIVDAQDTAGIAEVVADNAARLVTLDDGASINYLNGANMGIPLPWLGLETPPSVGADVAFDQPVILERRNNVWKLQPTTHLTAAGAPPVTFEDIRVETPENVGGDLKLATFNVLNYFPTTGEEWGCSPADAYRDRQGNPITVNDCGNNGPRGAWNQVNLERQEIKIVNAINALDADVVSLEEIENSVVYGKDRDFALSTLVDALNQAAGSGTWAFVASPPASELPPVADQDVIRNAFIYQPAAVTPVGGSKVLADSPPFGNAREPLAQVFAPVAGSESDEFLTITNHFKSKGSGVDDGTGQGNANPDRIAQAEALSTFADDVAADADVEKVFLVGDFNSYTMEDPLQVLYADGYTNVESDTPGEFSYTYQKLVGSLDHVLANDAALASITGSDSWAINSGEAVAYEYSRYNYNATMFYDESVFRSSDHDPQIVGIDLDGSSSEKTIQVLATNDFHGRLQNNTTNTEAGAAVLSGAVKQLRAENPDTVFAAAGDLIGASTFESFIQNDKPTIDALNEAGLEVSAVGNHEFDRGYDDLLNRVMASYDETTNPEGGAEWQYIGANVRLRATGDPAVPASWVKDFDGVEIGFVGAVTEDLPSLVSPSGITDIEVTDVVDSVNAEADVLEAEGADVIVLLVHEGAATTNVASATDGSAFGEIVTGVDANIDAIVSGHTHLAYNHAIEVPEWVTEGRDLTTRPVVSAGQYGMNLNQLEFTVDTATGEMTGVEQNLLALKSNATTFNYPADPAVAAIVADAVADSDVLGAEPLGELAGGFNRAKLANGSTENRGGESTLGNLVAEVQQWATEAETFGAAQIAFMNPGGLRADMVGTGPGAFPRVLTYKQAALVQPFANTLVNMRLTGADLKTVLEQQWQRDGAGNIPSRPFLRLGVSEGFTYTYGATRPEGDRITGMWLDGEPIDPEAAYSVTVNSFLASGGDNFRAFANGTQVRDTGQVDLEAMVDYLAEYADTTPLAADYSQRAVGVTFPVDAPATYAPGETVAFDLSSLAMTDPTDVEDAQVTVSLDGAGLGTFAVDNTVGTAVFDDYGTASVSVVIPAGAPAGNAALVVTGANTGTEVTVPITVGAAAETGSVAGVVTNGTDPLVGMCVYLYTSQAAASASYASCTQADGSYYVAEVALGTYEVAVSDPTGVYGTEWLADPVTVDGAATGVDVTLAPVADGAVVGTVTSGSGPVGNVCVFAYEEDVTTAASYASCSLADGSYALYGMTAGGYDIAFFDPAGLYPTQWSTGAPGGAASQAGAVAVAVPGSGQVTVDAVLSAETTGAVTGTVTGPGGPVAGVCVYLYTDPAGPAAYGTCSQADGTWWLGEVDAGDYRVGFADPTGVLATQWWTGAPGGAVGYAGGTPVAVTAGQTTGSIDAEMEPVP